MTKPKLTIVSISYNQEKYIAGTLEGFVMQKTNFPFEALIADDCSTDKTPQIIKIYAQKYSDIIKPIFREKNLGPVRNFLDATSRIDSEYVAICEGDDYWTDSLKLQKQVDFLDANPECSICFHPVRNMYEGNSQEDNIFPPPESISDILETGKLSIDNILPNNLIPSLSVVYRWRFNKKEEIQDFFPDNIMPGDFFLHLLHAQKGKIGFINEIMGAYRADSRGIWNSTMSNLELHRLKWGIPYLNFCLSLEKFIPESAKAMGHSYTIEQAKLFFNIYLKYQKFEEMRQVLKLCPDLY